MKGNERKAIVKNMVSKQEQELINQKKEKKSHKETQKTTFGSKQKFSKKLQQNQKNKIKDAQFQKITHKESVFIKPIQAKKKIMDRLKKENNEFQKIQKPNQQKLQQTQKNFQQKIKQIYQHQKTQKQIEQMKKQIKQMNIGKAIDVFYSTFFRIKKKSNYQKALAQISLLIFGQCKRTNIQVQNLIYKNQLKMQFLMAFKHFLWICKDTEQLTLIRDVYFLIENYYFPILNHQYQKEQQIVFLFFKLNSKFQQKIYRQFLIRLMFEQAIQLYKLKKEKNQQLDDQNVLLEDLFQDNLRSLQVLSARQSFVYQYPEVNRKLKNLIKIFKKSWIIRQCVTKFILRRHQKITKNNRNKQKFKCNPKLIKQLLSKMKVKFVDYPDLALHGYTYTSSKQYLYPIYINTYRFFKKDQPQFIQTFVMFTLIHEIAHYIYRAVQMDKIRSASYSSQEQFVQKNQKKDSTIHDGGYIFQLFMFSKRIENITNHDFLNVKPLLQIQQQPENFNLDSYLNFKICEEKKIFLKNQLIKSRSQKNTLEHNKDTKKKQDRSLNKRLKKRSKLQQKQIAQFKSQQNKLIKKQLQVFRANIKTMNYKQLCYQSNSISLKQKKQDFLQYKSETQRGIITRNSKMQKTPKDKQHKIILYEKLKQQIEQNMQKLKQINEKLKIINLKDKRKNLNKKQIWATYRQKNKFIAQQQQQLQQQIQQNNIILNLKQIKQKCLIFFKFGQRKLEDLWQLKKDNPKIEIISMKRYSNSTYSSMLVLRTCKVAIQNRFANLRQQPEYEQYSSQYSDKYEQEQEQQQQQEQEEEDNQDDQINENYDKSEEIQFYHQAPRKRRNKSF